MTKIILKNQDKTKSIQSYELQNGTLKVRFFGSDKPYTYSKGSFKIIKEPELTQNGRKIFEYLSQIAQKVSIKSDDGVLLLAKEFAKINPQNPKTTLFKYLNADKIAHYPQSEPLLFPFGSNLSQFQAVKNALESQVSIIEGPPGTGKTQTILNIIVNLLARGKSVVVVSNNNAATQNVLEKLENYDLNGICAMLGKRENKENFNQNQSAKLAKISEIHSLKVPNLSELSHIKNQINATNAALQEFFTLQNEIAKDKALLSQFELEFTHFKGETSLSAPPKIRSLNSLKPQKILYLKNQLAECDKIGFWLKVKLAVLYGIGDFAFYKQPLTPIILAFERLYYEGQISTLRQKIQADTQKFELLRQKEPLNTLKSLSMRFLKAHLAQRYSKFSAVKFELDDLYFRAEDFANQYPVIFSTTHSVASALRGDFVFDYLICDEASQVDLATGALALGLGANVVIVGDTKQLPNVIAQQIKPEIQALNEHFGVNSRYDYLAHSFLSSVGAVFADAPKILLKEHYRCHPKIIEFCNKRFYDSQLIILSEDGGEKDAIKLHFTAQGNHARGQFNQREIDEIKNSFLPELAQKGVKNEQIGIITPYNAQKSALNEQTSGVQIDTVHKFQGREKQAIIISVVNNEVSDFVDDPHILNVAITRAKRLLRLVVSPNFAQQNSLIGDFIKYIKYNNFEVQQSQLHSVFDLLYKQNFKARCEFLKNKGRISAYDSENLAYNFINETLRKRGFTNLALACHIPLFRLIKDTSNLDENEARYALNPRTHIDIVIFHAMDKTALLAVEVDGWAFHNENSAQSKRDGLKNSILAKYKLPLLRLNTTQSGEEGRILQALRVVLGK